MKLADVGEFGLIKAITELADPGEGVVLGIGDDIAVLTSPAGKVLLVTTDMLLQGVHFELEFTDLHQLGKKALAVNLSDIASCGGVPRAFVVSLAIPPEENLESVRALYEGMKEMAREFGVSLVGGDTSRGNQLMLTITLIGEGEEGCIIRRSGARARDDIFVTGVLGDAALGLEMLRRGEREGKAIQRHLCPVPRIREGRELARRGLATSMIDVSDGLVADMRHIVEASDVGAELWLSHLPLSDDYRSAIQLYSSDSYDLALTGGEDYELLFTAPSGRGEEIRELAEELDTPMTWIGQIVDAAGSVRVYGADGAEYSIQTAGHDHFKR